MLRRLAVPSIALATLFATSFATPASAGPTLTLATGGVNPVRASSKGALVARDQAHLPNGISFDDCEKDVGFTFFLTADGFVTGNDVVQAWAGPGDCTQTVQRSVAASGTCQPVSSPVAVSATFTVPVRGRDLAAAARGVVSPGNGGLVTPAPTATDDSACRAQTDPAATPINVVFLLFSAGAGANDAVTALVYQPQIQGLDIVVDTLGPFPPMPGRVDPAPSGVKLSWTPVPSPDDVGFAAFCAPVGGVCPGGLGGALVDGADGRTVDPKYRCGAVEDRTASTLVVDKLQPGTAYAAAVAGVDLVGNAGPLVVEGCSVAGAAGAPDAGASPATVTAGCACGVTRSASTDAACGSASIAMVGLVLARRRRRTRGRTKSGRR